jgi:hypothetical protein
VIVSLVSGLMCLVSGRVSRRLVEMLVTVEEQVVAADVVV